MSRCLWRKQLGAALAALQKREDRLLDVKEVSRRTTLSRARIHGLERAGRFPKRRKVSGNKVAWLESEIAAWISSGPTAEEEPAGLTWREDRGVDGSKDWHRALSSTSRASSE
jgi:prophage regulatory protein